MLVEICRSMNNVIALIGIFDRKVTSRCSTHLEPTAAVGSSTSASQVSARKCHKICSTMKRAQLQQLKSAFDHCGRGTIVCTSSEKELAAAKNGGSGRPDGDIAESERIEL